MYTAMQVNQLGDNMSFKPYSYVIVKETFTYQDVTFRKGELVFYTDLCIIICTKTRTNNKIYAYRNRGIQMEKVPKELLNLPNAWSISYQINHLQSIDLLY
jgi:hypothetical protein